VNQDLGQPLLRTVVGLHPVMGNHREEHIPHRTIVDVVGVMGLQNIQGFAHLMGMVKGQFSTIGSPAPAPAAFGGRGILEISRVFVGRVKITDDAEEQSLLGFNVISVFRPSLALRVTSLALHWRRELVAHGNS
jgi:hypothetical protein